MAMKNLLRNSPLLSHLRVPVAARRFSYMPEPVLSRDEVQERVLSIVKAFPKVDPAKVTPSSRFQEDLGMDSLDMVEVVMGFEMDFHLQIGDDEAEKILSVAAAVDYIADHPMAR